MTGILIALALARGLDAGTTCAAFRQGHAEANLLMPASCPATIGVQVGATVAQVLLLHHLAKAHPRAAKVLGMVSVTFEFGVSAHKATVLK